MAELEHVVFAAGGDDVLSLGVADAVRGDGNLDARVGGLDDFLERERGAGRGIKLGGVVSFADGELIAVELGQLGGEAEELLHADGEVGAVEERAAAMFWRGTSSRQLGIPAGGADDDAAAESEHSAHVFKRSLGGGEVDDDVDAGKSWAR